MNAFYLKQYSWVTSTITVHFKNDILFVCEVPFSNYFFSPLGHGLLYRLHTGVPFSPAGRPFPGRWEIHSSHKHITHTSQRTGVTRSMCVHQGRSFCSAQSNWWMKLDGDLWSGVLCAQRSRTRKNHKLGLVHDGWGAIAMDRWLFTVWNVTFLLHQQTCANIKPRTYCMLSGKRLWTYFTCRLILLL